MLVQGFEARNQSTNAFHGGGRLQGTVGNPEVASRREAKSITRNHRDTVLADQPCRAGERPQARPQAQEEIKGAQGRRDFRQTLPFQDAQLALHHGPRFREGMEFVLHE